MLRTEGNTRNLVARARRLAAALASLAPSMLIALTPTSAAAHDTLAGPLPKVLKAEKSPYLVIEDIDVPLGKTVTIEPGTVLLFKNFAGLQAQGRLIAEGSRTRPIVFTSEFDQKHNPASSMYPNPYDWNGIYIHNNALGSSLSFCTISYSVYGIVSETKFIRVSPAAFHQNGKSNLVIEGAERLADDGQFSYELSVKDAAVDGVPVRILRDPKAPARNTLRFTGLAATLGGAAAGVLYAIRWNDSQERLNTISSTDFDNLRIHSATDWQAAHEKRNQSRLMTLGAGLLGALGVVGFSWSFTF